MLDSLTDWIVFIVVVLILFGGANKIPELARGLGRAVGEFRKAQLEMEKEISGISKPTQPSTTDGTKQAAAEKTPQPTNREAVEKRIRELETEIEELKRLLKESS